MQTFFEVEANVKRKDLVIDVTFKVAGDISSLHLPKKNAPSPQRMGGLWETTCFELFLKNKKNPFYLEFNLATTGDWNCFSFDQYREGMQEYNGMEGIDITFNKANAYIILTAKIVLKGQGYFQLQDFEDNNVKIGISAVLKDTQNVKSYWSKKHYSTQPDFHLEKNLCYTI